MPETVNIEQQQSTDSGMSALQDLIPQDRMAELAKQAKEITDKQVPNPQPEVKTETAEVKTETKPEGEVKTEVKPNADLDALKKTTLFSDVATTPTTPIEIKDWEAAAKYLSENTGAEIKDFSDVSKIATEYKTLKEQSAKTADYENKVNSFENIFSNLPDDLFEAVQRHLRKDDYRSFLKEQLKDTIDFTIPVDKYSQKELLDYYYSGKFSAEDYENEDKKEVIDVLTEEAKKKFAADKHVNDNRPTYRQKYAEQQQVVAEKIRTTALSSWNTFSQGKTIDNSRKDKMGSILESGYPALYEMFFDKEGGYKPDAAERLFNTLYAKEEIEVAKRMLISQAKTIEDFISRGADNPNVKKSSTSGEPNQEELAKQYVKNLKS